MTIFDINLFGLHIAPSYYGLMYAIGFMGGYWIINRRKVYTTKELDNLLIFMFFGVVLWGRLWYVLFYDLSYYLSHPGDIVKTWNGGMSFHGGVIGVIIALITYSKIYKKKFLLLTDHITSILPIGIGLGRIGNYLNNELLGFSPYTGPLAVIKNGIPHFPSTLLESLLEGPVLFVILAYFIKHKKFDGQVAAHFLLWYGIFRFFVEFFRLPDVQIGYLFGTNFVTMGHVLSTPMIIGGLLLLLFLPKK